MSKTNFQDPGSGEIISPHISGLQEAVGKIEDILGMQTTTESDIILTEVYVSDSDRYRIFQAPIGKRNWVSSPAPVIKKNSVIILDGFTIEYSGGAIILTTNALETDVFTADTTFVISSSDIAHKDGTLQVNLNAEMVGGKKIDEITIYTDEVTGTKYELAFVNGLFGSREVI